VTPLYPQKLALTSPTGGGRSVGIVRSRTKATEFSTETYRTFNLFAVTVIGAVRYLYSYSNGKINEARSRGVAHLLTNLSTLGPFISNNVMDEL